MRNKWKATGLYLSSEGFPLDETTARLFSELTKRVRDEIDLLELSSRCRVYPTTLRKVLNEQPVSRDTGKKVLIGLGLASAPAETTDSPSTVARLRDVHRLYQEKGSLAAVGRTIGLSRERVRQLLVRGAKIGLFVYLPRSASTPLIKRFAGN